MKRGTAAKVILGKDTLMDVPAGIVHGTDVILGGKAGLLNDFGGLVLSNNLMIGKKVSRGTITTVTVRGQSPLVLPDAIAGSLQAVKAFGGTEQNGTPTPNTPVDIVSNNGVLRTQGSATGTVTQTGAPTPTTPVEPEFYQNHGLLLRAIGTDADTYDVSTQTITRNIGYYIFDGTETFGVSNAYGRALYINGVASTWGADRSKDVLCQYFLGASSPSSGMPDFTCFFNQTGHFYFRTSETAADFKAWLAELYANGTPLIVWFVNSTPETESFTPSVYADGIVETINVHGTNIFNKNDTENIGNWYSGSNQTIAQAAANETLVMRAKPNTTYYFKHCSVKGGCRAFYTEVEDWEIGSDCSAMSGNAAANANTVYSITTSANAKWIFFNYGRNNLGVSFDDQRNDFMVSTSELTSDTTYEQYFNGGSATAEMLLRLDGAVDEQEILTGAVTRNVKVIVFDGTEPFTTSTPYGKACVIQNASSIWGANRDVTPICTHFLGVPKTSGNRPDYTCFFNATGHFYFRLEDNTVATFKAWLAAQYVAGTPVMLLVAAATPTTESVTGQTLQVQAGDNVLEITQASLDGLELEATYKSLVQLTIEEVEDANLNNNVEVTIS